MNYIKESVNLSEGTIEEKRNEIKKIWNRLRTEQASENMQRRKYLKNS